MAIKREDLVNAAKDLNTILDPDPPIDVTEGVEDLKKQIKEAIPELSESDQLEENTKKVIAELTADPKENPKPAKKTAVKEESKTGTATRKTRMTEEEVTEIINQERDSKVTAFSKSAADRLLKKLRDIPGFACSRERFHPIYLKVLGGKMAPSKEPKAEKTAKEKKPSSAAAEAE